MTSHAPNGMWGFLMLLESAATNSTGATIEARISGLATTLLSAAGQTNLSDDRFTDRLLDSCATDAQPAIRSTVARFTGEQREASAKVLTRLAKLSSDDDATVRAAAAAAIRQLTSGSLTVDTQPAPNAAKAELTSHFRALLARPASKATSITRTSSGWRWSRAWR